MNASARTYTLALTQDDLDLITEIGFALSTENVDPVLAMYEPDAGTHNYRTPDGVDFCLRPVVTLDTLEALHALQQRIEEAAS